MLRNASTFRVLTLGVALALPPVVTPASAQMAPPSRIEITPFASYHWGGSIGTQSFSNISAGKLQEQASYSWGAILSFAASYRSAVELFYIRQDTDIDFNPNTGQTRNVSGFANNYIQISGRQDFPSGGAASPFVSVSMGVNVLDPKGDLGSSTRWSWSLGGGVRFVPPDKKVGVRFDARWLVTPVPSGTYGTWCDLWGCFAVEGTSWVGQGQLSLGLIIRR
jgi:hypothetical protein